MLPFLSSRRRSPCPARNRFCHIILLWFGQVLLPVVIASEGSAYPEGGLANEEFEEPYSVLFPWFVQIVGIIVLFIMTRSFHGLPYTALMFLIGTLMGIAAHKTGFTDQLSKSILMWSNINGEVVLLVFLPGLLFWDAFDVNFHLFTKSLSQLLTMAFPMVLAGASLTACVAYFIFPYEWSFMLSMTFGSILAATDPVAVAALLNEVGAPPRLKMHISGESMLNDGSAVVFYTVFSAMWLYELGVPGLGDTYTVGEGFAIFFRMSLGGTVVGLAFGVGLITLLYCLNRRLDTEENMLQVASTITVAYLSFFTAEITCHMSGVIAVVVCGITTRAFASGMVNDRHMQENFWTLVEHLLNTLLFTLGGVVWGEIISNTDGDELKSDFVARDWGYLILLYVLVQVIRFFLVFAFYPLLSRIGLGTNWQESMFVSFGGLRGAVGIALAISLEAEVFHHTEDERARAYVTKLFGMVGGVAFFTLVLNGSFAGPLLKRLGLAQPTETRNRIVKRYERRARMHGHDVFVHLLTYPQYANVSFAVLKSHVWFLEDLTADELRMAVKRNKEHVPPGQYKLPNVQGVLKYVGSGETTWVADTIHEENDTCTGSSEAELGGNGNTDDALVLELRFVFLDILRASYQVQVDKGELDSRADDGFLLYALLQSIEFASDEVSRGYALGDWKAARLVSNSWIDRIETQARKVLSCCSKRRTMRNSRATTQDYRKLRLDVYMALAFIRAHRVAQERFRSSFGGKEFTSEANVVIEESEAQVILAEQLLQSYDQKDVNVVISHLFCIALLNKVARYIETILDQGMLKEKEARAYIEMTEEALEHVNYCSTHVHPGEVDANAEDQKSTTDLLKEMKALSMHVMPMDDPSNI